MAGSISIRDLTVTRGSFTLRVDELEIAPREVFAILGRTGSGKTVLMESIAGAFPLDGGAILLDGKDVESLPIQQRHLGVVYQDHALFPHMTVRDNIAYGLKMNGFSRDEIERRVSAQMELFGIDGIADKHPGIISGGEAQRTALARALVLQPEILLLDEPFSALDAKIRQQMREELKKIQSDLGITVVFVTHDQEEAMSLSHRIVVMNKGKFEQIGTPTEIYDKPATRHVASFIGEMNFIDKDNKTIAVRPEDVTVSIDGTGDFTGTVRTIMVLGHYVVVNVQRGDNVIKCFVDRDISEKLSVGQTVGMHIGKHTVFDK